ncbi:MAG: hypothetical protein IH983_00835 [Planctomycetes bacterium]|nr:hypothetical protein [Planctomycetota bacterium]
MHDVAQDGFVERDLDRGVLGDGPGGRRLEEVIEPFIPLRRHVAACFGDCLFDHLQVLLVPDLQIECAVAGQDRALDPSQGRARIRGQEVPHPGGGKLVQLDFDQLPRQFFIVADSHGPFAVANQTNTLGIDTILRHDGVDCGQCIGGKVLRGCGGELTRGLARAAIVVTKHGDVVAGQVVGDHQERLVAQESLVTVLRART